MNVGEIYVHDEQKQVLALSSYELFITGCDLPHKLNLFPVVYAEVSRAEKLGECLHLLVQFFVLHSAVFSILLYRIRSAVCGGSRLIGDIIVDRIVVLILTIVAGKIGVVL